MKHYTYQQFLLHCPYTNVVLDKVKWKKTELPQQCGVEYNLFDLSDKRFDRSIFVSQIDRYVDSEEDFRLFIATLSGVTAIVIINDRPFSPNHYIQAYSEATMKALVYRIRDAGIECYLAT